MSRKGWAFVVVVTVGMTLVLLAARSANQPFQTSETTTSRTVEYRLFGFVPFSRAFPQSKPRLAAEVEAGVRSVLVLPAELLAANSKWESKITRSQQTEFVQEREYRAPRGYTAGGKLAAKLLKLNPKLKIFRTAGGISLAPAFQGAPSCWIHIELAPGTADIYDCHLQVTVPRPSY